eukprot:TRINITY_DN13203_c0_g1_i1.p1 TRINITY_DN13203_c0_g1~~TRINITY_DN13203_c0_g1_i1.p1  ORF type:complete len:155 (-),score=38.63 TRINITY_DN13203_c0_g1_i1:54-518(-)
MGKKAAPRVVIPPKTTPKSTLNPVVKSKLTTVNPEPGQVENPNNTWGRTKLSTISKRPWKQNRTRASSLNKHKPLRRSWKEKEEERTRLKMLKLHQQAIKDEDEQRKQAERERIIARRKRKEENELKGGRVQRITNTAKIKKMSKKQLRQLAIM